MILLLLSVLLAPQEREDPVFKHWSTRTAGAWVRFKTEVEMTPGNKGVLESTSKLLEVAADKVVVEQSGKMTTAGQDVPLPTTKLEILRKPAKFGTIEKEGDEEIEVAGRKLKCHWIVTVDEEPKSKVTTKFWFTPEIPGGLAKSETTGKGGTHAGAIKVNVIAWGEPQK